MNTDVSPEQDYDPAPDDRAAMETLRAVVVRLVHRPERDLTTRQLAVFLVCYMSGEAQTVRGLAAELNITKPPVGRAIDQLEELDLARRAPDPCKRSSLFVLRTEAGATLISDLIEVITATLQPSVQTGE